MVYLYEELTGKIIGCFYRVFDELKGKSAFVSVCQRRVFLFRLISFISGKKLPLE